MDLPFGIGIGVGIRNSEFGAGREQRRGILKDGSGRGLDQGGNRGGEPHKFSGAGIQIGVKAGSPAQYVQVKSQDKEETNEV